MAISVADEVQRGRPYGKIGPLRVLHISATSISPIIRIAHRRSGVLNIPERIIFDYEIVLVLAGAGEVRLGQDRFSYAAGTLFLIPPFVPHSFNAFDRFSGEHIAVHFDFTHSVPASEAALGDREPYEVRLAGLTLPVTINLSSGSRIERLLMALLCERDSTDPLAQLSARTCLTSVLIHCMRAGLQGEGEEMTGRNTPVRRVVSYIEGHLSESIGAKELAAAACLSVSRLNVLFKREMGTPPAEFLRRRRIERARQLLSEPALSIKEIAARTGFEDSFHFSKVFRKIDGLSPTRYREASLAGRLELSEYDQSE